MKNVAIITARGGSKRIPKKNIKDFFGKPMIAYAIEAAKNSQVFDTVMVSTDSSEIANIAKHFGADVPFMRSSETSNDFADTSDVLNEVISNYEEREIHFDNLCCVYPCVPFLKAEILFNAYEKFIGNDALIPVCNYPVPVEWAMSIESNNNVKRLNPEAWKIRSQDIEPKYYDVGMFYFSTVKSLLANKTLTPKNTVAYKIDDLECQDIDTIDDWKLAEIKYKILNEGKVNV